MDPSAGLLQEISSQSLGNMLVCSNAQQDGKPRPQPEQALKCPRCDSTNTKFCYYNNYSLSQPRYFCKSCRRYWTKGGTLRNVPVGGGCRKNKRSSSSASSRRPHDQPFTPNPNRLNGLSALSYVSNDLTLAIARLQNQSSGQMGYDEHEFSVLGNPSPAHCDNLGNQGFIGVLGSGFLENQNNLQSLYYGYRNGEFENGNIGAGGVSEEMMLAHYDKEMSNAISQAVTVSTVKQKLCSAKEQRSDNRVLWGFPWQFNGEGNIAYFDSGRGSWNSFNSSLRSSQQSSNVETRALPTQE